MISFKFFLLENAQRVAGIKANPAHQNISIDHDERAKKAGFVHLDPVQRSHAVIDHLASHDPTHDNGNKHTEWMVNQYKKGHMRLEDGPRIGQALKDFHQAKPHLADKDLNSYTLNTNNEPKKKDLHDAIAPHLGKLSGKAQARVEKHEGAELVHSEGDTTVHKLKTKAAACHYGKGTQWCTAADHDNMFDQYHKEGPLYVAQTKEKSPIAPGGVVHRKYQFHFQSGQFMDEKDRPVEPKHLLQKHPELGNVKEFKSHGIHSLPFMNKAEKNETLNQHMKTALDNPPSEMKYQHYERASKIADHIEKDPDLHRHFYPMANHPDHEIRQIAAIRGPHHIKTKLIDDVHNHVRMSVAETTTDPRHLDKLMTDRSSDVQAGVLRNQKTIQPSHAEYLAHHAVEDQNREQANWAHFQMTGKAVKTSLGSNKHKPGSQGHFLSVTDRMTGYDADIEWQKKRTTNKIGSPGDHHARKAAYAAERIKHGMSELKKHYPGVMEYHKEQEARFKGKKSKIPSIVAYQHAVMNGLHKEPK